MQRIEFKIRDVNRQWLEDILYKHGAEKKYEGEIKTVYYDRKSDDFLKKGKRITLRVKAGHNKLTFKDKYNELGLGIIDEWEVEVSDGEMMDNILRGLGLQVFKTFKVYRYDYQKGDVIISFDKYLGEYNFIPEYMMIEATNEDDIFLWAERFGYTPQDCEPISVLEIINMYSKNNPDHIDGLTTL